MLKHIAFFLMVICNLVSNKSQAQCSIPAFSIDAPEAFCEDSEATIQVNNISGDYTFTLFLENSEVSSNETGVFTVSEGGNYKIRISETLDLACFEESESFYIRKDFGPTPAVILPTTDPCANYIYLSAAPIISGEGTWSVISQNANITQQGLLTNMPYGQAVTAQYKVTSGVCAPSTATIALTSKGIVTPKVSLTTQSGRTRFCFDDQPITFIADDHGTGGTVATYEWFAGYNSIGLPSSSPTFTATDKLALLFEDITVRMISGDACVTGSPIATSNIGILDFVIPPHPVFFANDTTLCQGSNYSLSALGSGTPRWYKNGIPLNHSGWILEVNDTFQAGTYSVGMSNDVCPEVMAEQTVTVDFSDEQCPETLNFDQRSNSIQIKQNPFSHYLEVQSTDQNSLYSILKTNGRILEQGTLQQNNKLGQGLAPGIYLLNIMSNTQSQTIKIIKR